MQRVGQGYDIHRLVPGRPLILAGLAIPFEKGLEGHSDADVLVHAVIDALLGAAALGDIGNHFPDTDPQFKDADSMELLRKTVNTLNGEGYAIVNVDSTVIAETPKLSAHIETMRANLAEALGLDPQFVSIKAKTNEGVGPEGRGESIRVHAIALLTKDDLE